MAGNGWEDLSPSTTQRYLNIWDVHIREDIGRSRIASLSSYELERWYRDLKRRGLSESIGPPGSSDAQPVLPSRA